MGAYVDGGSFLVKLKNVAYFLRLSFPTPKAGGNPWPEHHSAINSGPTLAGRRE
jgi:hypothetical protein